MGCFGSKFKLPQQDLQFLVENTEFTKQQIAGRLRQLKLLYEDGLLTDAFYNAKVTECEAVP